VRRAHHYALKDGLAADQGLLLGRRKGGQELLSSQESQNKTPIDHFF
jgi:hypothetical protein